MRITIIATGFESSTPNLLGQPDEAAKESAPKDDDLKIDFPFIKSPKKDDGKPSFSSEYDKLIDILTRQ